MPRQFFVGGNWKMNPVSREEKQALVKTLNGADLDPATEVVVAPPALYLLPLKDSLKNDIKVAAQNCYEKPKGAFTGEISAPQLADAGIPYVILGHSERRKEFKESDELVAAKTKAALESKLKVILCVGEDKDQREAGETAAVVNRQLQAVVNVLNPGDWSHIVIAYEPVWAIGTGKVATPEQAQEAHADIRKFLSDKVSLDVAEKTRIIYGGSVTAANCSDLAALLDVDGFLVGGASLTPQFITIINAKRK
ncbi:Triosephosphate isomerase [Hygrophoropsis aurantiaca]|uniref:Triosephosphate isomerase n=1 Tax=Hygrophoropsis aurantiaca TaxID=72124 RepID=A0ACB8AHS4_9AGAM|nr:Triosephosphate isomerase [Hygrophoropsis aurantiaca]